MKVSDVLQQLQQMQQNGLGDYDVVVVQGNGNEKDLTGFDVVEQSFFTLDQAAGEKVRLGPAGKKMLERKRLRLFTHIPF